MSGGAEHRPFFLIGADRSGTTLLRLMLDAHPSLHVPRESWFLTDLMNRFAPESRLTDADLVEAAALVRGHPRWVEWEIAPARLDEAVEQSRGAKLADFVDALFRISAERAGKARWGDKTPRYVNEITRLSRLFPCARFMHIIRDGRDVCLSLNDVGWHGRATYEIAEYWSAAVETGMRHGRALGERRYMELRYEDLVLDTEATLRRVCDFIDEPYDAAMLAYTKHAAEKIAPSERSFQAKTARLPRPSDVERWKREMRPTKLAIFEAYAGRTMDAAGQTRAFRGVARIFPVALHALYTLARNSRGLRHAMGIRRRAAARPRITRASESSPTATATDISGGTHAPAE